MIIIIMLVISHCVQVVFFLRWFGYVEPKHAKKVKRCIMWEVQVEGIT